MSQSERDDYDDQRFDPKKLRSPKRRKIASVAWIVAWMWFATGVIPFFLIHFIEDGVQDNAVILFTGHLIIIGLCLTACVFAYLGKGGLLWFTTITSIIVGIVYGIGGGFVGLILLFGFMGPPTPSEQRQGVILVTWLLGFLISVLVAFILTLIHALKKSAPATWQTPADQAKATGDFDNVPE